MNSHTVHKLVYTIPFVAVVIGLTTVQSANAHTKAWLYGYESGLASGKIGLEGDSDDSPCFSDVDVGHTVDYHGQTLNLSADDNENRCNDGYTKGFDTTCYIAWANPNARHDIYGCPGISDAMINHQLDIDAANNRASLNSTQIEHEKAVCANTTAFDYKLAQSVNASGLASLIIPKAGFCG